MLMVRRDSRKRQRISFAYDARSLRRMRAKTADIDLRLFPQSAGSPRSEAAGGFTFIHVGSTEFD